MKQAILFSAILLLFLAACAVTEQPVACTKEAKICPDGTAVGRIPPNCEFEECPTTNGCNYDSEAKKYVGKSADECSRIKFQCEQNWQYFEDECGCGCQLVQEEPKNYCSPEDRKADFCTQIYAPVCGWFDPAQIQCIRYPCAQTFSNTCFACMDEKVLYWTIGE